MNRISEQIDKSWDDCSKIPIYEGEDYYEYYVDYNQFEKAVYDIVTEVLQEYEMILLSKISTDIEPEMDETRKELGI